MINLYEKGRYPSNEKEILTKSFLIDKIAKDMKLKYKKVLSFINYDEFSLKNDIHHLLAKYISDNKKEINIKYIETTLLNKVREKYRRKTPSRFRYNKNLIKILDSSSNKNIYIKREEDKKITLPVIKNKNINRNYIIPNINKPYSKTYENIENSKENEKLYKMEKKFNKLENEENIMNEEIKKEKDEILLLKQYKKDIQKQIDDINKEIEKEKGYIQKEQSINNNNSNIKQQDFNDLNKGNKEDFQEKYNWNYNPSMSLDQMKYLERKKNIEEDFYNKANKYTFLKPKIKFDINNNPNYNDKGPFRYNNIRINKNNMNDIEKIYGINKSQEIKKENVINLKNTFNDFVDYNNKPEAEKSKTIIPYEEKLQLKILQRSIAQEKAFNHLRNLLTPEKEFFDESNYQGFNNNNTYDKKKKEYEIADKARKIQIAKMRKMLDASIYEKEERKKAEKEFDKKYREINEREYENYLERENKKKILKNEKMQNYKKMLDEQIEQKKKLMFKNDENQQINLEMFS